MNNIYVSYYKIMRSWFICQTRKVHISHFEGEVLGYIISREGLLMDLYKIQTI